MKTPPLSSPKFEDHLSMYLDDPERALEVYLACLHGGWMLYQCLRTPARFQSTNYKLNAFRASNGVLLGSKNSPVLVDANTLFLQGAYREFDHKPSLCYVKDEQTFIEISSRFEAAFQELQDVMVVPDFSTTIAQTAASLHKQHNPQDTTEV